MELQVKMIDMHKSNWWATKVAAGWNEPPPSPRSNRTATESLCVAFYSCVINDWNNTIWLFGDLIDSNGGVTEGGEIYFDDGVELVFYV